MRIGLFGGSFNPIHLAHLVLADQAREAFGLDRVVFIPAKSPPHKDCHALAPARDRLVMVRLAVRGHLGFQVSDIELRRRGKSFTILTVRAMRRRWGPSAELFFLIGSDTVKDLPHWKDVGQLVRECTLVPLTRPGDRLPRASELAAALGADEARGILNRLTRMPRLDISASDIRRRVAEGRSIRYLTPDAVADYIRAHGLYRAPTST